MTEFVPSEFFAEDASAKEHKSHKKRRDQDPEESPKESRISWMKWGCIGIIVLTIVVVAYMYYKKNKDTSGMASQSDEETQSTDHDDIVANTSKSELTALLKTDFATQQQRQQTSKNDLPKPSDNKVRLGYLSKYKELESLTTEIMASMPPPFAACLITAKTTFENIKKNINYEPTEMDLFATYYGLDVMHKVMQSKKAPKQEAKLDAMKDNVQQQTSAPTPVIPPHPPVQQQISLPMPPSVITQPQAMIAEFVIIDTQPNGQNESFVEDMSDEDVPKNGTKKVAFSLDNGSDDEEE